MKCNKCGSELEAGAKFCAVCGEPVPQAPGSEPQQPQQPQQPYQSAPGPEAQQQPYGYTAPQQDAGYTYSAPQPQAAPVYANVPPVSGTAYLVWSIIVTIFCCLPLGIPGIVFASKIDKLAAMGDLAGAQDAAKKSKMFSIIGAIVGVVVIVVTIIFYVAVIGAAVGGSSYYY